MQVVFLETPGLLAANLCLFDTLHIEQGKSLMTQLTMQPPAARGSRKLSRRAHETLSALLEGLSEKQIAARLAISKNTVHTYVKAVYAAFGVASRGELLALWIGREADKDFSKLPLAIPVENFPDHFAQLHAERSRLMELLRKLEREIAEKKRMMGD
jgi:DNA-binding CsgD family transcriptional regulator